MNKKIKVIDLIEMFYKKEKMPQKIRVSCYDFEYDEEVNAYFNLDKNSNNQSLIQDWLNNASKLNNEVEILEDNTEEIEELPINDEDEKRYSVVVLDNRIKINELVRVVKKLQKESEEKQ